MSTISLPRRRSVSSIRTGLGALKRPELVGLLVLAGVLNLWALDQNGWANDYYSAAARSMASSWHNFFYESFDPSGVMTVDKPPLALWVQALSVKAFGFNSLALLVPQALMGMGSVALVYDLTRRRFGRVAGGVAGVVLALTPMTVAISRHNNPDALLVLLSVAALWFVVRALEDGRTKWIVWAGVMVGLAFETKMLVALLVVPGMVAAWLWVAPRGRVAAVRQLLAGGAAMVVVGGAWPLLMTLTPASDRPWISGTNDNSIWSLIFGYNGVGRIDGQAGGPQAFGGGGPFGGASGPLRLFNQALGGQAGWLLGVALVGGVAILVSSRLRRADARTGWLIAVGGAFLASAVVFSFAQGIFHPYYVSLLAPFTAALVGAATVALRRSALAPLAVAAGVVVELAVLNDNSGLGWLPAVLIAVGAVAVFALVVGKDRVRSIALAVAFAVLMIAPATWSFQTLGHATSGTFPSGGPVSAASFGGPGGGGPGGGGPPGGGARGGFRAGGFPGGAPPALGSGATRTAPPGGVGGGFGGLGRGQSLTSVLGYVKQHGGGAIGVSSQTGASGTIIQSGGDVVGLGGFSGRESEVSVSWLAQAVKDGQIRWVLSDGGGTAGPGRDGRVGSSKVMTAVAATCKKATTTSSGTLYDCQGYASALASYGSGT
jgi:4-amino-4-deoxy-L-arabinose transferase-like glycosyltransferase